MRWGEPIIPSSITQITPEGPRYRGRLATDLSRTGHGFEATADFLWTGLWHEIGTPWKVSPPPRAFRQIARKLTHPLPELRFRQRVSLLVQLLSATQEGNPEALLGGIEPAARQLIHVIAGAFAYLNHEQPVAHHPGESIVDVLTRTVRRKLDADDRSILNAALTLSADHELAPATFATRIAASTGAHLHACVVSGLGAFDGPLTGLGADRMEDLVRNARNKRELLESLHRQLRQGRRLFGFNHPIYPKGDPRARYLIEAVRTNGRTTPKSRMLIEVIDELESGLNAYPSLPVGLVAVELSMDLPTGSAGALFLLGRIAGWVAHVQEQRRAGFLLRPRAKYFGISAT